MNSLSWMIYLAELCGSVASACWLLVFAFMFALLVALIGYLLAWERPPEFTTRLISLCKKAAPVVCAAFVIGIVVPSKQTVYAIAASEMGEQVLKSPTLTKAQKALDAWLDKQISEQKPGPAK